MDVDVVYSLPGGQNNVRQVYEENRTDMIESLVKLTGSTLDARVHEATGLDREAFERATSMLGKNKLVVLYLDVGCNQDCTHCFAKPKNIANLDIAKENLFSINQCGCIPFVYATEPTANPKVIELYKMAKTPQIITNGITVAPMFEKLREAGIKQLSVSLHGHDDETHGLLANAEGHFNRVVETIRRAKDVFHVQVKTVIHRKNVASLENIYMLVKDLGAHELQVQFLVKGGEAEKLPSSWFLTHEDALEIVTTVARLRAKHGFPQVTFVQSFGPNFYSKAIYKYLLGEPYKGRVPMPAAGYCPASKTYFAISNNNLYPCANTCGVDTYKIGTWDKNTGPVIQNDAWAIEYADRLSGQCAPDKCEYNSICKGGCRGVAHAFTGDWYGSPPFCLTRLIQELL